MARARAAAPRRSNRNRSTPYGRSSRNTPARQTAYDEIANQNPSEEFPWIEPELPKPQPSFMDHGLKRGTGVLSRMQPLGTMPPKRSNKRRAPGWVEVEVEEEEEEPDNEAQDSNQATPANELRRVTRSMSSRPKTSSSAASRELTASVRPPVRAPARAPARAAAPQGPRAKRVKTAHPSPDEPVRPRLRLNMNAGPSTNGTEGPSPASDLPTTSSGRATRSTAQTEEVPASSGTAAKTSTGASAQSARDTLTQDALSMPPPSHVSSSRAPSTADATQPSSSASPVVAGESPNPSPVANPTSTADANAEQHGLATSSMDFTPKHVWNQDHIASVGKQLLSLGNNADPISGLASNNVLVRTNNDKDLDETIRTLSMDPSNSPAKHAYQSAIKDEKKRMRGEMDKLQEQRRADGRWTANAQPAAGLPLANGTTLDCSPPQGTLGDTGAAAPPPAAASQPLSHGQSASATASRASSPAQTRQTSKASGPASKQSRKAAAPRENNEQAMSSGKKRKTGSAPVGDVVPTIYEQAQAGEEASASAPVQDTVTENGAAQSAPATNGTQNPDSEPREDVSAADEAVLESVEEQEATAAEEDAGADNGASRARRPKRTTRVFRLPSLQLLEAQEKHRVETMNQWEDPPTLYAEEEFSYLRSTGDWDNGVKLSRPTTSSSLTTPFSNSQVQTPASQTADEAEDAAERTNPRLRLAGPSAPLTATNIAASAAGQSRDNGAATRKRAASQMSSVSSLTELTEVSSPIRSVSPATALMPPPGPPNKKQKRRNTTSQNNTSSQNTTSSQNNTPVNEAASDNARSSELNSENEDQWCSVCGEGGQVVTCDGCPRVHHAHCVDPPLDIDRVPSYWLCPSCRERQAQMDAPETTRHGVWNGLDEVTNHGLRPYSLPSGVQTHFRGNHVGKNGEYLQGEAPKKTPRGRRNRVDPFNGYDITPRAYLEFATRLTDTDGSTILCALCHRSAGIGHTGIRRPLAKCDDESCRAYWHLDCLDPPKANLPVRVIEKDGVKKYKPWICPRHVIHDLQDLYNPATHERFRHPLRIPRETEFSGYDNDGLIEVINHDENVGYSRPTEIQLTRLQRPEVGSLRTVRIPENVIVTKFIETVKANKLSEQLAAEEAAREAAAAKSARAAAKAARAAARAAGRRAPFSKADEEAAATLLSLSRGNPAFASQALFQHKAQEFQSSLGNVTSKDISATQRAKLTDLHAQLGHLLAGMSGDSTPQPAVQSSATAGATVNGSSSVVRDSDYTMARALPRASTPVEEDFTMAGALPPPSPPLAGAPSGASAPVSEPMPSLSNPANGSAPQVSNASSSTLHNAGSD